MFKRRKFTLIELIVVIGVLGILAAIVIPNISNFQNEARDAQLTADTRNVQTALDMYRLNQDDDVSEPILEGVNIQTVEYELDHEGAPKEISYKVKKADDDYVTVNKKFFKILDLKELYPKFLRQIPEYAVTDVRVTEEGTDEEKINAVTDTDEEEIIPGGLDFKNGGKVVFAVLLETKVDDADKPVAGEKSTTIVNALSYVNDELTIVK